jgi:hypothetical protein
VSVTGGLLLLVEVSVLVLAIFSGGRASSHYQAGRVDKATFWMVISVACVFWNR